MPEPGGVELWPLFMRNSHQGGFKRDVETGGDHEKLPNKYL